MIYMMNTKQNIPIILETLMNKYSNESKEDILMFFFDMQDMEQEENEGASDVYVN